MELFPVKLTIDGREHRGCKLTTDATSSTVWRWDSTQATAVPVLEAESLPQRLGSRSWTLETDDGTVMVYKDSGCGCGSKLKRWRPKMGTAARA